VLSQQAARSQAASQIQTPVQELSTKPPTLRQTTLPDALVGVPFHASVQATGGRGDVVMTLQGNLPPGLTMQTGAKTFAISGVPEEFGTYDLDITATDSYGQSARGSFTMRVLPRPLQSTPAAVIPDAETIHTADADNVFFPAVIKDNETINSSDADNHFFPSVIPDAETIHFTDTPNIFFPAVIKVTESIKSADADNSLPGAVIADPEAITTTDAHVITAKVGILPSTTPAGTYNSPYSQAFTAAGNTGTVTLTPSGTIPGLSFSTSGTSSTTTLSGTPTTPGTYPFTITAKDTVNTSVVSYSLVINKATQTITLGTLPTPTYGGASFTLSGTATSNLPVTFTSTSALATGSDPFTPAGAGSASFTASVGSNSDYNAATSNFNVTISPATLTLRAGSATRAFDQPNPSIGYTLSGFVNGDPSSVVSGSPVIVNTTTSLSPVSGSPYGIGIIQGTLTAANYAFNPVAGSLTITQSPQIITFYPLPNLTHGTSFPLSARSSSGLPVSYSVTGGSITNNILTVGAAGPVSVTALQAGNGNYTAATSIVRSFTAQ
jgi:hypothetical protein